MNTFLMVLMMVLLCGCASREHNEHQIQPVRDYDAPTVLAYEHGTWKVLPFLYEKP